MIKYFNNFEHLEVDKAPINISEKGTLKSTASGEASIKNVEKESDEIIETNVIKLVCDLCEYKCKNKSVLNKHLDSKHGGHKKMFYM